MLIKFEANRFEDSEMSNTLRCHYGTSTARNSFSSMSSLDVEANDNDELTTIPEIDDCSDKSSQTCEIFSVSNAKQCNSIIR